MHHAEILHLITLPMRASTHNQIIFTKKIEKKRKTNTFIIKIRIIRQRRRKKHLLEINTIVSIAIELRMKTKGNKMMIISGSSCCKIARESSFFALS